MASIPCALLSRWRSLILSSQMSDPRQVVECIKVGLAWHKLLNLRDKVSIGQNLDKELEKIETDIFSKLLLFLYS